MMTVKEYAVDTNTTIAEILKKCRELEINVTDGNSMLSEDDVVALDNTINLINTDIDTSIDEEEVMDEVVENILASTETKYNDIQK